MPIDLRGLIAGTSGPLRLAKAGRAGFLFPNRDLQFDAPAVADTPEYPRLAASS